jgi:hypothetical protein
MILSLSDLSISHYITAAISSTHHLLIAFFKTTKNSVLLSLMEMELYMLHFRAITEKSSKKSLWNYLRNTERVVSLQFVLLVSEKKKDTLI